MTELLFKQNLIQAIFLRRVNRFILECELSSGEIVEVHLADPGRLKEILLPNVEIWLEKATNPNRKTKWTAVMCRVPGEEGYVSLNTLYPNQLVMKAFQMNALSEFDQWVYERAEFKVGASRFDFLLREKNGTRKMLVEVKSVTMVEDGVALFPDAVTARGTRHLSELQNLQKENVYETSVLFIVQRNDARKILPASHIDPQFSKAMKDAAHEGVSFYGRSCKINPNGITLRKAIPVYPLTH
ncbi:sugar fermentation stimulation protein A [Bacillus pakistanensis]|uniref:Sugar fermentation stimulation protein homolog n=1 Tax=Rossellomorea pakistanensis TaxID=992288 RepID=A0ABS2NJN0_9BACI|nr:DNA/RNA nuclease SfsA [Bacillus pakistanensis]MBM7588044.1 sugar fermentation stimulation protein A [Bacillus pakistanensis]